MTPKIPISRITKSMFVATLLAACGGSQTPAESPEASPAAEPMASDTPDDGQHTMPDGSKMEGEHHGEHTMPDGSKMEGHEHGERKPE